MSDSSTGVLKGRLQPLFAFGLGSALIGYLLGLSLGEIKAQVPPPPITSSGLNTQVSAPVVLPGGETQHNITGGTRPGGGGNLFHSFGEFGVPTNNIANFLNDSAQPTSNILGRVTGGNPSNILGAIQTEGFGNANLFIMNPAGIVFGPDASLNVGGSTHFTTADYLKLGDGVQFTALPNGQDALLSVAPVAAFGFLNSTPNAISVEGSTLSVNEGQDISLVGGDITIGSGLNASGGTVALASVASPGEILAGTYADAPNINGDSFGEKGTVTLQGGSTLNVSGDAAGTVVIRGGQLMMTNAVISADTVNQHGAPVAIDIETTGDISIATVDVPALTARTSGTGNAGEVQVSSGGNIDFSITAFFQFLIAMIDTQTSGPGNAGDVTLASVENLNVTGDLTLLPFTFLASTGTDGLFTGEGGDVSITAKNYTGINSRISTGNFFSFFNFGLGAGEAGDVTVSVEETIDLSFSNIITDSFDPIFLTGANSGNITLTAKDMFFNIVNLSTSGFLGAGDVIINTDTLRLSESNILSTTNTNTIPGGAVTITGRVIELLGSNIISSTNANANGGDISITASDRLSLLNIDGAGFFASDKPSIVASTSGNDRGVAIPGNSGNIQVSTPLLEIEGGSKINTSTGSSGKAGDISISGEAIFISGETGNAIRSENFGNFPSSGIFSGSLGGGCVGLCGDGGTIIISTESLVLNDGAQINSSTSTEGVGGAITVNASEDIAISGTLLDGSPGGVFSQTTSSEPDAGAGGNISLTAGETFFLGDGATVSASSTGPGNAGNILITAT